MLNKIEPNLLNKVNILDKNKKIKCLVKMNKNTSCNINIQKEFANIEFFPFINSLAIDVSFSELIKLAKRREVQYISSNTKVFTQIDVAKKIIGIDKINPYLNTDFSCAIIDTGFYPHLDYYFNNNKILNFIDLVGNKTMPYDDNGHGTIIANILAGGGYISGNKYGGVDKNLKLVIIKALNSEGETGAINILRGMQWVLDNKKKYNIRLVCMSFGSNVLERNDPLIAGAEVLWNNGIIVVCACGNSGPNSETIKSPSASSKIISVGALDDARVSSNDYDIKKFKVAEFSSRGPILNNYKPDLVVSGVDLNSGCNFHLTKKFYSKTSGTSVATPIVAGVCSLILRKNPNLSPNQVKRILLNNCIKISGDRNSEGYGWLNMIDYFKN